MNYHLYQHLKENSIAIMGIIDLLNICFYLILKMHCSLIHTRLNIEERREKT